MEKQWLNYWKKSLSDGIRANIDITKLLHFEIENFNMNSENIQDVTEINRLFDFEERRINKKKGIVDPQSENWIKIDDILILIAPLKIVPLPEHLVFLRDKSSLYPFWYYAKVNRNGQLSLPDEFFPIFQRKHLEPLADERTEFIFTTVERVDEITSYSKEKYETYSDYISYIEETFKLGTGQLLKEFKYDGYNNISNGIILLPEEDMNAAIGIINLYANIIKDGIVPSLLKKLIALKNSVTKEPIPVKDFINPNDIHLGQMSFGFPLSISQRKSLYTLLENQDKIFAVNGPPGTGKTTLIQSLVANKVVECAINGGNAPIIVACSTNNQAITNIIDSFSNIVEDSGKLEGRWLPEIKGYATYLTSAGRNETELKGINYKKLDGEGLFSKIEQHQYIYRAKEFFLLKVNEYFNLDITSIAEAYTKLQGEIKEIQSNIKKASVLWKDYLKSETVFVTKYLINTRDKEEYFQDGILSVQAFDKDIADLKVLEEKIITYFKNEGFFRKLFCLLRFKSSLANRASELRIILRDSLIEISNGFIFKQSSILELINYKIELSEFIKKACDEWKSWKKKNSVRGNPPRDEDEYLKFETIKVEAQKIKNNIESQPNSFYDELDVTMRHKAFQLAVHYWEGRWLKQVEIDLMDINFTGKGLKSMKNRWNRQAMVTPCFVSTFYMSPKFFNYYMLFGKGEDGRNLYDSPPLYGFIDLLIVDEAGQVSPEVGIATFALAKQAVIVGDIKQIEPVWNVTNKIDIGNLKKEKLIKDYNDPIYEKEYNPKGFLSSTGSIMKIAQNASDYKELQSDEKGIMLTEHRRCYDEIINYCNVLAYKGKLNPLKGKADITNLFPPMYCIDVKGNSIATQSTRYNQNEVDAIVDWLRINKAKIESQYGKIENALGIITPFVGQKNNLKNALKKAGFNTDIMKIGTVHALQGAERSIILFSMVYGPGDSGTMFFDRDNKPNMLNVAVSRAKESFIVFANIEILNKNKKTPSGILANYLTYH